MFIFNKFFYIFLIIMNNNNYKILLDEYELLSNSLNTIFKNVNIDIKNILTYKNIKALPLI